MDIDLSEFIADLTHFEMIDSYYSIRSALISDVTIFMTLLFAYLTVAYLVSAKLSRFQAISISALYSLFTLYMISSAYTSSVMLSKFGYAISGLDSSRDSFMILTILMVSWVFSIILFVQARRIVKD